MLFGLTIFLSAFLLFQVQLIVAKHLLPWFGGAPSVWTTCQLFFQVALLGGYAYAHLLTGFRSLRHQGRIHLTLLFTALLSMAAFTVWSGSPLLAPEALKPNGSAKPAMWLLLILAVTVGLPFFLLSATGPLLQRWHSHSTDSLQRTYRLYALSNAGSLLGLLSYPFGLERLLDLPHQADTWTALFVVFVTTCAVVTWRSTRRDGATKSTGDVTRMVIDSAADSATAIPERRRPLLWFLLSFSSSAMFLSTTNQLTIEVASIPFLWVLPLAIYLLTFIACFDHPRWYVPRGYWIVTAVVTMAILPVTLLGSNLPIHYQVFAFGLFLALFCMMCHGELVRLRPGSSKLTQFYLLIAIGGAAGGAFVSLAAPAWFPDIWEFNVTVLLGWAIFGAIALFDRASHTHTGNRWQFGLAMILICMVSIYFFIELGNLQRTALVVRYDWRVPLVGGLLLAVVPCVILWRTSLARDVIWNWVVMVCVMLVAGKVLLERVQRSVSGNVLAERNFYGVLRLYEMKPSPFSSRIRYLVDGNTTHGVQLVDREYAMVPTAYYSPSSGIAIAARYLLREAEAVNESAFRNLHLGVLGMGAGTMAAFAEEGDRVRFYEFNPAVVDIAASPSAHFTFVRDSKGKVSVVTGDGRLSLERELREKAAQQFDLLAMDAFSSDAVPVHLLTEEAFEIYAAHLRGPDSILAVNITNRHLDLEPVVAASARRLGLQGIRVDSKGDPPVREQSSWILLARNHGILEHAALQSVKSRPLRDREVLFTDRYSNLFRVLK